MEVSTLQKVRALFLDFDGVLVESVEIKSKAFRDLHIDQPADILTQIMAYRSAHDGISRYDDEVNQRVWIALTKDLNCKNLNTAPCSYTFGWLVNSTYNRYSQSVERSRLSDNTYPNESVTFSTGDNHRWPNVGETCAFGAPLDLRVAVGRRGCLCLSYRLRCCFRSAKPWRQMASRNLSIS